MMSNLISAKHLNIFYRNGIFLRQKKYIIKNFNITIKKSQIVGLTGESGKGKTTLGKTLLGLHKFYEGEIFWNDISLKNRKIKELREKYTWLGQESFLMFNPNKKINWVLKETIKVVLNHNQKEIEIDELIKYQCGLFKLDLTLLDRYPFELSAGQIQRFSLIRNLLVKPDFIVLDEPTSSLDPYNSKLFLNILEKYLAENIISILFISHKKSLLTSLTNIIYEL